MSRVVHFEISANDPEKVTAFYQNVFGWKVTKWDGPVEYWLVDTANGNADAPGINGGVFRPKEPFTGTVNTIDVDNVEAFMEKTKTHGGEVVTEKMTIPGIGYFAYCKDVEGTLFGIMQGDENAR